MKGIERVKFTRISATFAFVQRAIVKNRRFCTHQWPEQNYFNNYKIICRAENFIAKIGDFCLLAFTFILTEFRSNCRKNETSKFPLKPFAPKCTQSNKTLNKISEFLFVK